MTQVARSRSVLTLYTTEDGIQCHRVRLILAAKGVTYEREMVDPAQPPEDLAELNPYGDVPTLVERDMVLYDTAVVCEYLDERYPHPPLMPVDPVHRAQYRMALFRFEADLYTPSDAMDGASSTVRKARSGMQDALARLATDLLPRDTLGDDYSLLDCTLAPILWRLDYYRLRLPTRQDRLIRSYGEQLFRREAFIDSLSSLEADMRQPLAV